MVAGGKWWIVYYRYEPDGGTSYERERRKGKKMENLLVFSYLQALALDGGSTNRPWPCTRVTPIDTKTNSINARRGWRQHCCIFVVSFGICKYFALLCCFCSKPMGDIQIWIKDLWFCLPESVVNFLAMATEQHVLRKHHCKIEGINDATAHAVSVFSSRSRYYPREKRNNKTVWSWLLLFARLNDVYSSQRTNTARNAKNTDCVSHGYWRRLLSFFLRPIFFVSSGSCPSRATVHNWLNSPAWLPTGWELRRRLVRNMEGMGMELGQQVTFPCPSGISWEIGIVVLMLFTGSLFYTVLLLYTESVAYHSISSEREEEQRQNQIQVFPQQFTFLALGSKTAGVYT